jgi:proteasome activator subunit 4
VTIQGASTTGGHADTMADKTSLRITKPISKYSQSFLIVSDSELEPIMFVVGALAKIMVYSMSLDGPARGDSAGKASEENSSQQGFLAGSHALDTLDKLITSTESFFHPSNTGHWTLAVGGVFTTNVTR